MILDFIERHYVSLYILVIIIALQIPSQLIKIVNKNKKEKKREKHSLTDTNGMREQK